MFLQFSHFQSQRIGRFLVIFLVGILDLLTEFVDIAIDRDLCWVAVDDSDNLSRGRRGQKNSRRIATDVLPGALNALAAFGECMSALNKLVARIHEIWSPNFTCFSVRDHHGD